MPELERHAGVHPKHAAFKDVHFVRLIQTLRERERKFRHKARIWREVSDVHAAAIKAAAKYPRFGRNRLAAEMAKPGCLAGPLARNYLFWLKRKLAAGDKSVLRPKVVPLDVRAFWELENRQPKPNS